MTWMQFNSYLSNIETVARIDLSFKLSGLFGKEDKIDKLKAAGKAYNIKVPTKVNN